MNTFWELRKNRNLVERLKKEFDFVEIKNHSYGSIFKEGQKDLERLYALFDKERKGGAFLKNSIVDVASTKLQIWFPEDLIDLADFYLKKELELQEIVKEKVKKDEEHPKYS